MDIEKTDQQQNLGSIPEEGDIYMKEEMEKKNHSWEKNGVSKKAALFLICYGLGILLLSINISTNVLRIPMNNNNVRNKTEMELKNQTTCHVNELSKVVTLACGQSSKQKNFHLGSHFDFTTCDHS